MTVLNNKTAAAEAFTAELDTGEEISGYGNSAAAESARAYITAVTDGASLADALATLPETVTRVTGARPDNAPTGSVIASGTAIEGQILTASQIAVNLVGNALDNVLTGNAAANTLTGNGGNDTLAGGAGNDTYVVE